MINYKFIDESIKFYEKFGFQRIESPWLVSEVISNITKPRSAVDYKVSYMGKNKSFVASGEQSFLYLINKGFLTPGSYQTITPCMRHEDFDDFHTKYFIKNELIHFGDFENNEELLILEEMINSAKTFFNFMLSSNNITNLDLLKIVKTEIGYDIEYDGVELGSYGIRSCKFVKWIYGTGLAEPRFSRVLWNAKRNKGA